MLQRIYGTAFFDKKELDAWLKQQEEAKKRDHRRLGKELDLFEFFPESRRARRSGPPRARSSTTCSSTPCDAGCAENGYVEIKTPLLYNKALWEKSGHWGKYRENMFLVLDNETGEHDFSLKPMNCPSHHLYFASRKHSYRELPLRYSTQDVLHRNEASGSLSGLTRVRQFAQDDAHIYCTEDQIADEVKRFIELLDKVYAAFGLTYVGQVRHPPATAHRRRRAVGPRRGRARVGARRRWASPTSSSPATARSTARRSTST